MLNNDNGKKIVFCVHGCAIKPIGGHKVIYEYANRLVMRGYAVEIMFVSKDNLYQLPLPSGIRVFICKVLTDYLHIMPGWFKFEKRVKLHTIKDYADNNFPKADFVVATAIETAYQVSNLPKRCGQKIYLIQDIETWNSPEDVVTSSFGLGMKNVVISDWLKSIVEKQSKNKVICVPNAIDTTVFKLKNGIEQRKKHIVGILYHKGEHKGLKYSIDALCILKKDYPEMKVLMFGTPKRPDEIPDWIDYSCCVPPEKLCDLYNHCSIFMCGSINEGFGLTGAESMACGCALVSTDYPAVHEYAKHLENALLCAPKSAELLADNVKLLFENDDLRIRIAKNGYSSIQNRSWDKTIDLFEKEVLNI